MTGQYCKAYTSAKTALEILLISGQAAVLLESISARMIEEMWEDMDNDSEKDLPRMRMMNFTDGVRLSTTDRLHKIFYTPRSGVGKTPRVRA